MPEPALGTRHISAVCDDALFTRLVRQAGKETEAHGKRITPSDIIRWAIEDYLAYWETAPLVPEPRSTEPINAPEVPTN